MAELASKCSLVLLLLSVLFCLHSIGSIEQVHGRKHHESASGDNDSDGGKDNLDISGVKNIVSTCANQSVENIFQKKQVFPEVCCKLMQFSRVCTMRQMRSGKDSMRQVMRRELAHAKKMGMQEGGKTSNRNSENRNLGQLIEAKKIFLRCAHKIFWNKFRPQNVPEMCCKLPILRLCCPSPNKGMPKPAEPPIPKPMPDQKPVAKPPAPGPGPDKDAKPAGPPGDTPTSKPNAPMRPAPGQDGMVPWPGGSGGNGGNGAADGDDD